MDLLDKQKEVDEWVQQFEPPYWPALEKMARLTEEVGELAREIKNLYGTKKKKDSELSSIPSEEGKDKKELAGELIDVIFTIICIANDEDINLEKTWQKMVNEKKR